MNTILVKTGNSFLAQWLFRLSYGILLFNP